MILKQVKKLMYYVAIQWVYEVCVNYIIVHVSLFLYGDLSMWQNVKYILDVLATGGRDSIINIYDRRYSKKRQYDLDYFQKENWVFLIEGALCPISSISCAHISSTALQKSARVCSLEKKSSHNFYFSYRKIHVVLLLLNFKMNIIYIPVLVLIGKKNVNLIDYFLFN
jgi:hypothetical protein